MVGNVMVQKSDPAGCPQSFGTVRSAEAREPIFLAGPDDALMVVEGHVDVFAVRVDTSRTPGVRYPLFRAEAGDLVVGLPTDGARGLTILAVGGVGTRIRTGFDPRHLTATLAPDQFEEQLCRLIQHFQSALVWPPPAGPAVEVSPDESRRLAPGEIVRASGRNPIWISASADTPLRLCGVPDAVCSSLPLTSKIWASAKGETELQTISLAALIESGRWFESVRMYLDAYRYALAARFAWSDENRLKRLRTSNDIETATLDQALRGMASRLGRQMSALGGGGDGDGDPAEERFSSPDPQHAAFRVVARALAVDIGAAARAVPPGDGGDALESLARTYKLRMRRVLLREGWWQRDNGPLIAKLVEKGATDAGGAAGEPGATAIARPVALLPLQSGGYRMIDPLDGTVRHVDEDVSAALAVEAVMLYRPLPENVGSSSSLTSFVAPLLRIDLRRLLVMGAMGGVVAALTPFLTGHLIESVLPRADATAHLHVVAALIIAAVGAGAFEIVKLISLSRMEQRADLVLQSAIYDHLLRLPTSFFRRFTTGDLADRVLGIQMIRQMLTGSTVQSLLGMVFSIFSLALMFIYNWQLAFPALGLVLLSIIVTAWLGRRQLIQERARIALQGCTEGFVLQLISGIAKLRVAGAERRAYARWAELYAKQKQRFMRAQAAANLQDLFQAVFPALSTAVVFALAVWLLQEAVKDMRLDALTIATGETPEDVMSVGDFIAFNAAFGQLTAAMVALVLALTRMLAVVPVFERLRPVLAERPEEERGQCVAARLRGTIEVKQLSFRYAGGSRPILDSLSFSIEANEFVAIVGPSGSGKSTLVRLLLGFDKADSGDILFDGVPIQSLDLASLRRQMQVVLQNGRLIEGSIFTNISGNSQLSEEEAWRGARAAGIDTDIEALPMGMHTVITEGVNILSGGQRQRLLLARALAQKPAILVLDEPTSALDNTTQDLVMNTLAQLSGTRIVIAHRLSTVRHADRILVMDRGQIVQQGCFDDLLAEGGLFAELAKRQMV